MLISISPSPFQSVMALLYNPPKLVDVVLLTSLYCSPNDLLQLRETCRRLCQLLSDSLAWSAARRNTHGVPSPLMPRPQKCGIDGEDKEHSAKRRCTPSSTSPAATSPAATPTTLPHATAQLATLLAFLKLPEGAPMPDSKPQPLSVVVTSAHRHTGTSHARFAGPAEGKESC
ncbi:hypothetical protein FB45DRAFT_1054128 [Roridomyces roridus]|uniref:F-box domain-containing protein n=1 Tax=Roridomyces roridus TaxID=1738132 RepID=A0AAD7C8C1_9AGAR|nr:hypothetical protein FB45DRAFT_1054128 [Roridomyces roridus]